MTNVHICKSRKIKFYFAKCVQFYHFTCVFVLAQYISRLFYDVKSIEINVKIDKILIEN